MPERYYVGDTIDVMAPTEDAGGNRVSVTSVTAQFEVSGEPVSIPHTITEVETGLYRVRFEPEEAGIHRVKVTAEQGTIHDTEIVEEYVQSES